MLALVVMLVTFVVQDNFSSNNRSNYVASVGHDQRLKSYASAVDCGTVSIMAV